MNFIELPDFPEEERAQIRKLLGEYRFSPAQFSIYATTPTTDAQNLNARTVHVEHLPTKQKRALLLDRAVDQGSLEDGCRIDDKKPPNANGQQETKSPVSTTAGSAGSKNAVASDGHCPGQASPIMEHSSSSRCDPAFLCG